MSNILKQVERTIEAFNLLTPGDGVVVGVSGGPDSLCLLHTLLRLREQYSLRLTVAHLHHGARGADADADAEFVASLAREWGLPVTIERIDVPALARAHKTAFEETARRARYAFLARVAGESGALKIAVGHNADDQAETVLMHFLRGAGPAGLRGMLPRTPLTDYRLLGPFTRPPLDPTDPLVIIRPLLSTRRSEIEGYCASQGLAPRFDRSNLDTTYFRNRLRHELLPLLETYNPNIKERICHTAAVIAADYELLAELRERAWGEVARETRVKARGTRVRARETRVKARGTRVKARGTRVKARGTRVKAITFGRAAWRALPVALQRATLRRAAYQLRRTLRDVDFYHVENARRIGLKGETGAQATLPMGLALTVGYDTLTVGDAGDDSPLPLPDEPLLWRAEPLAVQVPGKTELPGSDWTLHASMAEEWDLTVIAANPDIWTAYLDAEQLGGPLSLRPRRSGDRFHPQGMAGHGVKLGDFMINLKIPRAQRDHVPLLVAGEQIVWVCGRRIGERAAVRPETRRVIRLQFSRLTQAG